MKTNFDIWKWLMPLALLAAACGHDDLVVPDIPEEEPSTPYVELRIAMPANASETRSYPTGGEEGDGRERGILKEDIIHDINIFFYIESSYGLGMDSQDDTEIIKHMFYNLDDKNDPDNTKLWNSDKYADDNKSSDAYFEKNYLVLKFECSSDDIRLIDQNNGINFVVIANIGKLQTPKTLKDLRNYDFGDNTNNWTKNDVFSKDASSVDYFLMSTAYNNGIGTGTNKITKSISDYSGTTTLQRMYARIDLWYNKEENAGAFGENEKISELKYSVKNAEGNYVYLTNVLPINVMKRPSYVFKKVTDDSSFDWIADNTVWEKQNMKTITSFKWGGKESPFDTGQSSVSDMPTNYVMERHTLDKVKDGKSSPSTLEDWYGSTAVAKVETFIQNDPDNKESSNENGKISAYYHYEPTTSNLGFDCDHVSIISYANENTHPTDCFHSNYLTGMAFRAVYVPDKIYKAYSSATESSLEEMTDEDRKNFYGKIYRYSPSKGGVVKESESIYFSDYDALEAYRLDHIDDSALVTVFDAGRESVEGRLGFICYYNLWLRHYNDSDADPQGNYPMEYAIVRNNIYRVSVSFNGPGDPTPTMREPDTMQARLYVIKWNFRPQPEIIM